MTSDLPIHRGLSPEERARRIFEPERRKQWDRVACIGVAKISCTYCHGTGTRPGHHGREIPCNCAFRAIFRACYARYRECQYRAGAPSIANPGQAHQSRPPTGGYGLKNCEFLADFELVARRTLSGSLWDVFEAHFLWGLDWRDCCWRLGCDRGDYFHALYTLEQRLGEAFARLEPYGLWPIDEYFGGTRHNGLKVMAAG